jgi:phage terminase small subunit
MVTMNTRTARPDDVALNARQRLFVAEYLKDKNATQAAIRTGYSARSAKSIATENLSKPAIRSAIDRCEAHEIARVQEATGITLERTLTELGRTAFYDVRKLFHEDGSPKAIQDLDDETASAVEGIEVVEQFAGSGQERQHTGTIRRYKLAKRTTSLDMILKHLNAYKANEEARGAGAVNALAALIGDMRRSSIPVVHEVGDDE